MFLSKKNSQISQSIICTLVLITLVLTTAGSSTPEDDALRYTPTTKTGISSAPYYQLSVRRYLKASDWIQELGRWAQDQMGIPHDEHCDIYIDGFALYSCGPEAGRVENNFILLVPAIYQTNHGVLVYTLLHEAKHKASAHEEILLPEVQKKYLLDLIAFAGIYSLPLGLGALSTYIIKSLLIGAVLGIHSIGGNEIAKMLYAMEREADTAALAAMSCSACLREAGRARGSLDWVADRGYLLEDAFIKRAEELEAQKSPLCEYHIQAARKA